MCEDPYGDWWDNYWWIIAILAGIILTGVMIYNIWSCCDPKFERTKRNLIN
jgi:phage shock protein PspC (stress-responsive transcriptional regulator)